MTQSSSNNIALQILIDVLRSVHAEGVINFFGLEDANPKILDSIKKEGQNAIFINGAGREINMRIGGNNKEK